MENLLHEAVRRALDPICWKRSLCVIEEVRNFEVDSQKPFRDIDPAMVHPVLNMLVHHRLADRREASASATELHSVFGRSTFEYVSRETRN